MAVTITFVLACIVGMLLGRTLVHRMNSNTVQKVFATTVIGVAFYLIYTAIMA